MAIQLPQATRQSACDDVVDLIDVGAGTATIVFYAGAVPDPDSAAATEVATIGLQNPAFGAADANGLATANTPMTDDTSATGGTVTHFRALDRDGTHVYQGTVTATAGGGDIELNSVVVGAGATVSLTSLTFQVPQDQT